MSGMDWRLGLNQDTPINALMQGARLGNAFNMQREDRRLQQEDRDFNRQRVLQQDARQAKADTRQDAAFGEQQKQWSREEQEFFREGLLREARSLRLTPPEMRVAAFRQRVVPVLQKMGVNPEQIEPQLNDEALSDQEIDAFEAMMGGAQAADQRGMVLSPGSQLRDPRTGHLLAQAPFAPQLRAVGEGQSLVEIQPGGGGGPMAAPELDFGQLEGAIVQAFPGTQVTSRQRTPAQNQAAGGVPNSHHLTGNARDLVPPQGMSTSQFAATLKSQLPPGVEVIDEGDHVHIEPARQSAGGPRVVAQGAPRAQTRILTAQEVAKMGLPAGTVAQQLPDGRIDVVSDQRGGGRPVPQGAAGGLVENRRMLAKVERALAAVDSNPRAFGMQNYRGDFLNQRMDAGGVDERALIADIGSAKIHERSGAAVSAAEFPRLKPFVPQATDPPEAIKEKLKNFRVELQSLIDDTEAFYGPHNGYLPIGAPASAPPPAATGGWKIIGVQ
jgi:hypothetical protein